MLLTGWCSLGGGPQNIRSRDTPQDTLRTWERSFSIYSFRCMSSQIRGSKWPAAYSKSLYLQGQCQAGWMCIIFHFEIDSLQCMLPTYQSRNEPTSEMGVVQRHLETSRLASHNVAPPKPEAVFVFGNKVFPTWDFLIEGSIYFSHTVFWSLDRAEFSWCASVGRCLSAPF